MPDKRTVERARRDMRRGESASTAAGEFVRREIHRIRGGAHGAKNAKQAIAIGLSEARRAGVPIPDKRSSRSGSKRRKSTRATRSSRPATRRSSTRGNRSTSRKRSQAALKALRRQPRRSASHLALSRQAHRAARRRSGASRSAAARKAARTRAQRGK